MLLGVCHGLFLCSVGSCNHEINSVHEDAKGHVLLAPVPGGVLLLYLLIISLCQCFLTMTPLSLLVLHAEKHPSFACSARSTPSVHSDCAQSDLEIDSL